MNKIIDDKQLQELHNKGMGFIFNDFDGMRPSGIENNILHKASCNCILKSNTNVKKIFFENETEAFKWLDGNRKSNWKHCGTCLRKGRTIKEEPLDIMPIEITNFPKQISFYVHGEPSSFSTAREKPWKMNLEQQIPSGDKNCFEKGVIIDFHLESMTVNGQYFDVDNLCEPVFSVLINNKGWFNRKRPNIQWFRASKIKDKKSGCNFRLTSSKEAERNIDFKNTLFDKIYSGNLPKSATDDEFISWIKLNSTGLKHSGSFYLNIEFGDQKINLGDIATGRIKSIIDCLYPVIGGNKGAPTDWKIDILDVQKGVTTIPEGSVRIQLAEL